MVVVGEVCLRTFGSAHSRKFGSLRLETILVDFGRRADFRPGRFLPDARKLASVGQISSLAHVLLDALENLLKSLIPDARQCPEHREP